VYNDTKQPYFNSMEDYLNRSTEQVGLLGAQNLANMLYGLDNNYEANLPENKFLKKYKFIDDKLRYVDKQGRLIDAEGRLIDESGRFIDDQGNFVDKFGNKVDQEGDFIVEPEPFLDDDGNPIVLEDTETVVAESADQTDNSEKPADETKPVESKTEETAAAATPEPVSA
jgi:hypothetical protein